ARDAERRSVHTEAAAGRLSGRRTDGSRPVSGRGLRLLSTGETRLDHARRPRDAAAALATRPAPPLLRRSPGSPCSERSVFDGPAWAASESAATGDRGDLPRPGQATLLFNRHSGQPFSHHPARAE